MPSSNTTGASSTSSTGRSNQSSKPSKTVVLKVPSTALGRFPGISAPETADQLKASSSPSSTTAPPGAPASSAGNASDAASTPAPGPGTTPTPATDVPKRKGIPGPKPGSKRGLGQGVEAVPKPRGKPGPKKKPRLEDGTIDNSGRVSGLAPAATHKLGPKASLGAINAGLRALDRTGKPCRRWERKPFQLKSFTGVVWQVPTWRTPKAKKIDEPSEGNAGTTPTGESDSKANNSVSAVGSEKSNSGEGDVTPLPTHAGSSPAPVIAVTS